MFFEFFSWPENYTRNFLYFSLDFCVYKWATAIQSEELSILAAQLCLFFLFKEDMDCPHFRMLEDIATAFTQLFWSVCCPHTKGG